MVDVEKDNAALDPVAELQAAVKHWRGAPEFMQIDELYMLSAAYIASLDNAEVEQANRALPVDADYLRAVGFQTHGEALYVNFYLGLVSVSGVSRLGGNEWFNDMEWYVGVNPIPRIETRGQLLDLLSALRIEVKRDNA